MAGDDSQLFRGTAEYYARYRPGYPRAFFDFVRKLFSLDGTGRLLDLGCGTGQALIPLAKDFEEVVGLDPEPEMLVEAKRQAKRHRVSKAQWILGKAEDELKSLGHYSPHHHGCFVSLDEEAESRAQGYL